MKIIPTEFDGLLIIEPAVFTDARGAFLEAWRKSRYAEAGLPTEFVQHNVSRSQYGVLRGMHFQNPGPQGKLICALEGEVFDAVVDLRRGSSTFGKWFGIRLDGHSARQLFVPAGFAHGFGVLSASALVSYLCTAEYNPAADHSLAWNDPQVGIHWPIERPILSEKDARAPLLAELPAENLFAFQQPK